MLSLMKLVFLSAILVLCSSAPLRVVRSRQPAPAPVPDKSAKWAVPLRMQAQHDSFGFDLTPSLAVPPSTVSPLTAVPENCAAYTSECPASFSAVNVMYGDCGDAWTVCRCNTANMTMDTVVERLGRVPVGLRRYVATVVVSPDVTTHAYTLTSGDIHMFGDTEQNTWVHEAMHAFDWASGTPISHTEEWINAIQNDTCVPDTYSTTCAIEAFAQVGVLKIYSLANKGALPDGWDADCLVNQWKFMNDFDIFNQPGLFGPSCAIGESDYGARHTTPPQAQSPPPPAVISAPPTTPKASPTVTTLVSSTATASPGNPSAKETTPPSEIRTPSGTLTPLKSVPTLVGGKTAVANDAFSTKNLDSWRYILMCLGLVGLLSW